MSYLTCSQFDQQPAKRSIASTWVRCLVGVMVVWIASINCLEQSLAGCSTSSLPAPIAEVRPVEPGQLTLAIYIRYERGSFSYTLERPSKPCEGPACRSKSSMEPTPMPISGPRLAVTQVAISTVKSPLKYTAAASYSQPTSLYAPRGYLEVAEPPPKPSNGIG